MKNKYLNLILKFQLFYPVLIALVVAIIAFSVLLVNISRDSIFTLAENDMMLEVSTIKKMFERERELKLENVKVDLKVANQLFYQEELSFTRKINEVDVTNQFSLEKHKTTIRQLTRAGKPILYDNSFPDKTNELFGGTTTIFQVIDSGMLRISTNVLKADGNRAVGTFIPNSSIVTKTIKDGKVYYGRAFVVNDWYITAYEPIFKESEIIGALYVGQKEKDIDKLRETLNTLRIGNAGFSIVIDNNGNIISAPSDERRNAINKTIIDEIMSKNTGVFEVFSDEKSLNYMVATDVYDEFDFHIAILIPTKELTYSPLNAIVWNSVLFGSILIILIIVLMITLTTRRVHRFLNAIRQTNVKLKSTKEALKRSEENFETIFQNSSDEIFVSDIQGNIIEINDQASFLLGYTRDELLNMNILDIKPLKHAEQFLVYRKKIINDGGFLFDSEYITKEGETIPVETNSRVLEFNGQTVILSISRNLAKRKETERKVLSAVIQTEEKERERFSKDMHDGLGPLLSTIKLYVNELGTGEMEAKERKEYVNQVNRMLDDAVTSIREISNNLMPRVIHEYGLVKALEAFCEKVNQTGKIYVDFKTTGIDSSLDKNVQLILFRVISELLTNTIKHAQAKNAYIQLQKSGESISLIFSDNGIGFNSKHVMENKNTGIGLKSIVSRIKSINGHCDIYSEEGKGFKITIEI